MIEKPTKRKLFYQYIEQGTISGVADYYNTSEHYVGKWLEEYDIPTPRKSHPASALYHPEHLRKLYQEENSLRGVLTRLPNSSSQSVLLRKMEKYGIKRNHNHSSRGEKVEVECSWCGGSYIRYQSEAKLTQKNFCSKECESEWNSLNNVGESNPNWEGGTKKSEMYSGGWRRTRRELQDKKDSCELCGISSEEFDRELDAHHIKPVRSFDNYRDAHSLDNLALLCRDCHTDVENSLSIQEQRELFK